MWSLVGDGKVCGLPPLPHRWTRDAGEDGGRLHRAAGISLILMPPFVLGLGRRWGLGEV